MPDKVLEGWRRQRPRPVAAFGRRQDPKKQSQAYISEGEPQSTIKIAFAKFLARP